MADQEGWGNAQESQVSIGTGERTVGVGEITLTENLNDTRHIDILIKQSNGPRPQASGVGAAPEDTAALNGRLKITVVVEKDTDKEEGDIPKEMRGWLMTVGTLFVTMAFQAALQPPAWMRTVDFLRFSQSDINRFKHPFRGVSLSHSWRAGLYMTCNGFTFATALWLVLVLLWDIPRDRAKRTTKGARRMMVGMGISAMFTFALGISAQWLYTFSTIFGLVVYALLVVWYFKPFSRRYFKPERADSRESCPIP